MALSGIAVDELVGRVANLKVNRATASGRPALYQPITLLWAIGRARRGEARIETWADTDRSLRTVLERHGMHGERPRPDYPVAALTHAGLWELHGHNGPVPAAHGDAELRRWFEVNQPSGGLPIAIYDLVRRSGTACVAVIDAILDSYFQGEDCDSLLQDLGLSDSAIADDLPDAGSVRRAPDNPRTEYDQLCRITEHRETHRTGGRVSRTTFDPVGSAAACRAVLLRSEGQCENPGCTGQPADVTDRGDPILEVDHVDDLAHDGRDHPRQMIALCPNCHAIKTRGRTRERLREILRVTADTRHTAWRPAA